MLEHLELEFYLTLFTINKENNGMFIDGHGVEWLTKERALKLANFIINNLS